jgi:hypothetical protein
MVGTRIYNWDLDLLPPGGYAKDESGIWHCRAPVEGYYFGGNLRGHKVEEHKDGTISVTPSILIQHYRGKWHGYLKNGNWETLGDSCIINLKTDMAED